MFGTGNDETLIWVAIGLFIGLLVDYFAGPMLYGGRKFVQFVMPDGIKNEGETMATADIRIPQRAVGTAYILWLVLFPVGAHRFYLRSPKTGLLYILLFGLGMSGIAWPLFMVALVILWMFDGVTMRDRVQKTNLDLAASKLS